LAKSFDLSQFDGIVCVSGDGVLVEVCFASLWKDSLDLLIDRVFFI